MSSLKQEGISLTKALILSFLSVVVIAGTVSLIYTYYEYRLALKEESDLYALRGLILSGRSEERLTLSWVSEALDLSKDAPINLYKTDLEQLEKRFLVYPFIKTVSLSPLYPSILDIQYELRSPLFELGNRPLTAVDGDGVLFSLEPLYPLQQLPLLWLAEEAICSPVDLSTLEIAKRLSLLFLGEGVELISIDLSRMRSPSLGFREVILTVQRGEQESVVRLPAGDPVAALDSLFLLLATNGDLPKLVDLRFPNIALIE